MLTWAPNTRGRHVNNKATFRPLAGVKGYSFKTSKRFMKGGGDVGTTTYRWDIFPQVSVKESPFHKETTIAKKGQDIDVGVPTKQLSGCCLL